GHFAVESFFDVTYQIEFEGCPGSILEGLSGVTTATIRIQTGEIPACVGGCPPGETCVETITENPDGTIDVSCECIPLVCEPTVDGSGCKTETCANPSEDCLPVCAELDLLTGDIIVTECECKDAGCYLDLPTTIVNTCVNPDNGTGTIDLPPAGCQYESPDDVWMIIDGLPPGTTIEMEGILMSFSNLTATPGGSLGGEVETFDSYLDLTVSGTGMLAGFNRHLSVPVSAETHSGPRNPGDPIQNFQADMFELFGELFGDPDFCTFRVIGGTNYGLPSPGQTKLTQLPSGDFAVESFFDITYQIEFEGCPGSMLDGFMGTTTATIRMQTGTTPPECAGECPPGWSCEQIITYNVDGTIDVCCECINETCDCIPGEADETPPINILDIVLLINFKYKGGPSPAPYALCNCDATCNCVCDILDIVHVINFKYKGGAAPCNCNTWVTNCGALRK
ncbi:MAG: hypothetical protein GY865_07435, partial [candidate division Zixibacteria bacterium]|nr:hypothetical protein [candidate division Zixibacteria bacterium]